MWNVCMPNTIDRVINIFEKSVRSDVEINVPCQSDKNHTVGNGFPG